MIPKLPGSISSSEKTMKEIGKDDAFAGSEVAHRITGKLKNSNLVEFEHAGHLPWLDNPKEHSSLISQFLSAQESAGFMVGYQMNKVV